MQFKWNYTPPADTQGNAAKDLGEKLGISPILASLLIRRGITTESAAKRFFRPQLADLINPFLMKDMDAAVDRLNDAMGHKERILVYGDYDVDGCTAVALVYKFLRQFYSNIDYYIPDRYDEGYGVSKKGIDFAKETGVKLIIILDCGIKAIEEITYAKEQGIDFIICDHHVPDEVMPPAVAILNPKRPDDGLNGRELSMSDIIFKIGPRINASGRMENGKKSVDLLVEREYSLALNQAKHIDEYNEQRKDVDRQMTEEANQIVARLESQKHQSSIVLYDEHWKKGVIGIVASRLTEIYFRPTVVLTRDENLATGSARSVAGFDVYAAIKSCRDLLLNFGGHTYAAGLTMKWADVKEFRERFQAFVEEHIEPEQREAILDIDAVIDFKDITKKLHTDLKRFAPFGPGNSKPLFCTLDVYDFGTSKVVGREQEHIKLELVDSNSNNVMNGIAFGQSASARYIKSKRSFDIAYTIEDNVFKRGAVQLQIEDIRPTEDS